MTDTDRTFVCACDMRHPDDDSPFEHDPRCYMGRRTMNALAEPVDPLHAECLAARDSIRSQVARIRTGIAAWQPQPYEPTPTPTQTRSTQ